MESFQSQKKRAGMEDELPKLVSFSNCEENVS